MNQMVTVAAGNAVFGANLNGELTMSSREIAELCGKQHGHVIRDIEKMLAELGKDASKFGGMYADAYGRQKPEHRLPKDLTVTLITGYRADLRYKVVKRLEELEEAARKPAFQIPQNYEEALEAHLAGVRQVRVLTAEKTALEAKVEEMIPAVEALERIATARTSMGVRASAKALQMTQTALTDYLITHRWAYRPWPGTPLEGYSERIKSGHLEHKVVPYGVSGLQKQLRITPKGLTLLAKKFGTTLEE